MQTETVTYHLHPGVPLMPNGKPAPTVLTEAQAIEFLRLNETSRSPARTLQYWRSSGKIRSAKISRAHTYHLEDLIAFLRERANDQPKLSKPTAAFGKRRKTAE